LPVVRSDDGIPLQLARFMLADAANASLDRVLSKRDVL
jgi:hypothetical protein